jgi:predicted glycogen debranching enzyme
VTNGLGGYACGTVALANTRRYHAFLMASLAPPVERTLLVAKIEVSVDYRGRHTALTSNEFAGGSIAPQGFAQLESFAVHDGVPVWTWAVDDALIEQQIFMAQGANTSYLRLELRRASGPLRVILKPFTAYRDQHAHGHGEQPFRLQSVANGCQIDAYDGARTYQLSVSAGSFEAAPVWYRDFWHREEAGRGMDATEDLFVPGSFHCDLVPHAPIVLTASCETPPPPAATQVLLDSRERARRLHTALPKSAPEWIRTLAHATDQFIVRRGSGATSVIAGYPWFGDWGRDTMIALPGLTTLLGRHEEAAAILRSFAAYVDRGMLPNRFPEHGETPEYNTADATLWLFQAVNDYFLAKRDPALLRELIPVLSGIVHAHVDGTRYGIGVDPADGLLRAGEAGLQLTWMDAKFDTQVFTPRIGKPVEINALWINALNVMVRIADGMRDVGEKRFFQGLLDRAQQSFGRFWNERRGCLYDVLDTGSGNDDSLRPNQIIAVALPLCGLPPAQIRAVVDTCARELLTSYGLRTLDPRDPRYLGRYEGDMRQRDSAYHMGTAWAWLLGPYARAHYRVYGDARLAQSFLSPIAQELTSGCIGSVAEIFDGDAPHMARGCFAQAWSVAEILRSWVYLERKIAPT